MGHRQGEGFFTERKQEEFLKAYAKSGLFRKSAKKAGVCAQTVYNAMERDTVFKEKVDAAYEDFKEDLEEVVKDRVLEGVKKDVYYKGDKIGEETQFSDRLTELVLKRHVPEYRDKSTIDMNQSGGIVVVSGTMTKEEWLKKAKDANKSAFGKDGNGAS